VSAGGKSGRRKNKLISDETDPREKNTPMSCGAAFLAVCLGRLGPPGEVDRLSTERNNAYDAWYC
jgi:hypothetical protein